MKSFPIGKAVPEDRHYADRLLNEGYNTILKYGICFCKKSCMAKIAE